MWPQFQGCNICRPIHIYNVVVQEHEATTVGVLLGMATAHQGTMDPAIFKVISTLLAPPCIVNFVIIHYTF
jgi:hypothetical protein